VRLNVVYLASGFPTPDNPSHGIFNLRAANALKEHVNLTVIQYRIFKPGRKLVEKIKEDGFNRIILCVPYSPVGEEKLYYFNNRIIYRFTRLFAFGILRNADLVHASDGNLGVVASWLKKRFSFKLLVQFIGGDLNQDLTKIYRKSWMKDWLKKLDAVTFNSKSLQSYFNQLFGSHPVSQVIYRGVNTDIFHPSNTKAEDEIVFYFLGGLPAYSTFTHGRNTKGGMNLMAAWKKLEEENPASKMKLLFAGPDADLQLVRDWRQGLGVPGKVEIYGKIAPSEIASFHRKGDVALLPSLEEGLPNVALEAMATGNLVIGNRVGGIPEVILDNANGLLCATPDAEGLFQKMTQVLEQPGLVSTLGQAARKNVVAGFSHSSFAVNYISLYQNLLKTS